MNAERSAVLQSRRHLLRGASAVLSLSALPAALRAEPLPQTGEGVAAGNDGYDHMTVPVTIDGKGPFRFVVDTGADRSILSDRVARALQLSPARSVVIEGVVRRVPAETVRVRQMSYGVGSCENRVFPVLPYGWLHADGFLGLDMIDSHRVTFDFRARQLRIERPASRWAPIRRHGNEESFFVSGSSGRLRALNCRVDSIQTTVFIDTGASVSIGNLALYRALCEDNDQYTRNTSPITISGVTGGSMVGRAAGFRRIRVRDLVFSNGSIAFANLHIFALWDLIEKPAMLLGMNFLRQFNAVSIDYGRKAFTFELASLRWMVSGTSRLVG